MKRVTLLCALALFACSTLALADDGKRGISLSFNSDDAHTQVGPRHAAGEARMAITTRDGSTSLLLLKNVVAVQLTDQTLAKVKPDEDEGLLAELVASGVRVMLRKSVEYPLTNIRSVEVRDGVLTLLNDKNQPVFQDVKINGQNVMRSFSPADATRFVNAYRAAGR